MFKFILTCLTALALTTNSFGAVNAMQVQLEGATSGQRNTISRLLTNGTALVGDSSNVPQVVDIATQSELNSTLASYLTTSIASSTYQPLDSDLTAVAALTTSIYGRSFLSLVDASALQVLGNLVVGTNIQAYDADLDDLADGSLTGTKVGFADTDGNFAATNVQAALEEFDDVNGGGPNAADGKVEWSQLIGVPAGFADGSDDGGGGGGSGTLSTLQESGVAVGDADIVTLNFGSGFDLVESPDTKITVSLDASEVFTGGDLTWSGNTPSVGANAIALSTDTTGNYVATIADAGLGEVTVTGSGSEGAAVTIAIGGAIARDLEIAAQYQPLDADLTVIAGLVDPNADRIVFWDDSAGAYTYLTATSGIAISGTSITADLGTAIDSTEIIDGAIMNADINASAAIAFSKLESTPATAAAPSLTGVGTVGGTWLETPSSMAALVVDVTKINNTKSDSADRTVTFSATPSDGQWFGLTWINTDTASHTITIPACLDGQTASSVTSFTVPAASGGNNGRRKVYFERSGASTIIHQGGGTGSGVTDGDKGDVTISGSGATYTVDTVQGLTDPAADRILFWDDSAGGYTWLTPGTGISITGTTMTARGYQETGAFSGTGTYAADVLYSGTMSADATVTLSLTAGQRTGFDVDVTGSTRTMTFASAYRVGYSGAAITTLALPVGRQRLQFYYNGSQTILTDSVSDAVSLSADVTGTLPAANIDDDVRTGQFGITIDGAGSAISTGVKGDVQIPYNCTISSVTILADTSGSIVVDVWKDTYANYPPTVADTITASAKPTISSSTKATDSTLTGWTTTVSAGDTIRFNVDSASSITRATLIVKVIKN